MADIPYMDKLEIKMMAEALYEIDKFRFAWTQKFLDKDYLATPGDIGEDYEDLMCAELEEEHNPLRSDSGC